jgi:hypothetical protein
VHNVNWSNVAARTAFFSFPARFAFGPISTVANHLFQSQKTTLFYDDWRLCGGFGWNFNDFNLTKNRF